MNDDLSLSGGLSTSMIVGKEVVLSMGDIGEYPPHYHGTHQAPRFRGNDPSEAPVKRCVRGAALKSCASSPMRL